MYNIKENSFVYAKETYLEFEYKVYLYKYLNLSIHYFYLSERFNNVSKIFHTESSRELDDKLIKYLLGDRVIMFWVYNKEKNYIESCNCYNLSYNIFITIIFNNPCKHLHQTSHVENDYKLLEELDIC